MEGLGPDIRKLAEEPVYTDGFKPGAQNPRISQTTSSGFPNNEVFSAKESLKLPEGSVYLLSALHPGVLSKTSFEGKRQGCVCVCVCRGGEYRAGKRGGEGREGKGRRGSIIQLKHLKEHRVHSLSPS